MVIVSTSVQRKLVTSKTCDLEFCQGARTQKQQQHIFQEVFRALKINFNFPGISGAVQTLISEALPAGYCFAIILSTGSGYKMKGRITKDKKLRRTMKVIQ